MQYLGGKSRTRNQIAAYLNRIRQPAQAYWEPFCGACWVTERIYATPKYASDANGALIAIWQALQAGWIPPDDVSEAEYATAMAGEYEPHLTAFILIGCSFGGKWGAGYARGEGRNWASEAKGGLFYQIRNLQDVTFTNADFFNTEPPAAGCLIYCDPPYAGTTDYGATGPFDSDAFWQRVRMLETAGHTCVISEYAAPDDFTAVWQMRTKTSLNTTNGKDHRIEKLFRLGNHKLVQPELF